MSSLFIANHPLIQHHIAHLRDKHTPPSEFRERIRLLAGLLAYEATQDLSLVATKVETPVATTSGFRLKQRIGIVPILRAGLGMVDPFLNFLPTAEVWHLGLYRDEQTAQPVEYYQKLPDRDPIDVAIIVDPMLATGGSAIAAIEALRGWGVESIKLCAMIAAPEGVEAVQQADHQTQIYTCTMDERLNDQKFIVPGLGDAGDRIFNTLP